MNAVNRIARRAVDVCGLAAIILVLPLTAASPAVAAPSFSIDLTNDADEVQAVYVEATTGQFRLNFGDGGPGASETVDIPATATTGEVQNALNALTNISSGGGSVSVKKSEGDSNGTLPYLVTFDGGPLAMRRQSLMSAQTGAVPLGASPLGGGPAMAYVTTRSPGGISRSDERIDYTVAIQNGASSNPAVGDTLTCDARSANWFQSPTFSFKWIRSGDLANPLASSSGGTTSSYLVQAGDAGHSIQCYVLGTNAGGAAASFSPPASVEPVPSPAPPAYIGSGNPRPAPVTTANGGPGSTGVRLCTPPVTWAGTALATASTSSGSNQLTSVSGGFSFAVGQEVIGLGIPERTTITAVAAGTLTLSASATATASAVEISATSAGTGTTTAGSNVVTSLLSAAGTGTTTSGSTAVSGLNLAVGRWTVGLPISGPGIPVGTTVTATSGTGLTLSQAATASGAGIFLTSESGLPFAVGQEISAPGVPTGTSVTAVGAGTLTLSASATASAASVVLAGNTAGKWSFQWLRNGQPINGAIAPFYALAVTGTANISSGSNQLTTVTTARGTGTLSSGSTTITGLATLTGGFTAGQAVAGTGIPAGSTIVSVAAGSLEISAAATASGSQALSAGAQPFAVGQKINGAGIPVNSTVTAVSGQTVTISSNATATTTGVSVVAGGSDVGTNIQCAVTMKSGSGGPPSGGTVFVISNTSPVPTQSPTAPNSNGSAFSTQPFLGSFSSTSGMVTAELELPGGLETFVYSPATGGTGWACTAQPPSGVQPAKAICTRSDSIAPGASYPPLLVAMGLGKDAPGTAVVNATVSGGGAPSAATATDEFAFYPLGRFGLMPGRFSARAVDAAGEDFTQAGGHPAIATTSFSLNRFRQLVVEPDPFTGVPLAYNKPRPIGHVRNALADIPPGFIGNPRAVPDLCPKTVDMLTEPSSCPPGSIVGDLSLQFLGTGSAAEGVNYRRMVIYAMKPEAGVPAQFAAAEPFNKAVYSLIPRLRPSEGYAISVDSPGIIENPELLDVRVTLCGYGTNTVTSGSLTLFGSCKKKGDPGSFAKPFLTTQTECVSSGPVTKLHVDSWENPGEMKTAEAVSPKMTGCEIVPFDPKLDLLPTSKQAESASGLEVDLSIPSAGLEDPDGLSQAHLKRTTVTLPKGMSVNPGAADGLAACTQAELGMVGGVPNDDPVRCPDASKLGTAVVKTPILEETLEGAIYLAKQRENPFGTLMALYVVVESKERGILIKIPGKVEFRPGGQVVSTFDDNPQAPFSSLELSFDSSSRAALLTPAKCGTYDIVSELTPWSAQDPDNPTLAETRTRTSTFQVDSGPGGSPCPDGSLRPTLKAGLANPLAGSSSAFAMSVSRPDASQRINRLELTLPPGLTASLKGVPYCSDGVLNSIPGAEGTGAAELANPSCPAASKVGSVSVGAGAGNPFYVHTGKAYLAGPYKDAPVSLAVVVPAVAGPFDLGNVVVRNPIYVNPKTAQVTVKSDPLPTFLHGVPLDVRDIRVNVDRPNFTQAPTSCEVMSVDATVGGEDGASVRASNRFQVGECAALAFKPSLKIQLHGGTKRAAYQRLEATVTYPKGPGYANIARAAVTLPHSSFLAQEHIRTVCTRVQFAAKACPKGSIYGRAEATTPLLDGKLSGPVYLRSSNNPLPDLVAALRGPDTQPIEVELAGRTDSKNGGLRNTFDLVPDAPVSKFTLKLMGGKKSLIVNSRDLCTGKQRATVRLSAHNGKVRNFRTVVGNDCGKKKGKKRR